MIVIDGRRISPATVDGNRLTFDLPAGASKLCLQSTAAVPAQVRPWLDDRRQLGIGVNRLALRDGSGVTALRLDGTSLGRGWWAIEGQGSAAFRWTDGAGMVALDTPALRGTQLELTICALAPVSAHSRANRHETKVASFG